MLGRVTSGAPRYEAFALLGAGGLGRVYRAVHHPSGTGVALKTVFGRASSAEAYQLLVREASAAAQLRHPNVVELLDFVVSDGRPYLVLELVEGRDIEHWLDAWPGSRVLASAVDQILDGLGVAHAAGILHRDLKPANVLLTATGQVKITDFGMAELVDPLALESDRAFGGTPLYMAPEQLDPAGWQGPWTDLYAVGAIHYALVSGREPLDPSEGDLRAAKRRPPRTFQPRAGLDVPSELGRYIERMLAPEIRSRPRFVAEVRSVLASLLPRVRESEGLDPASVPSSRRNAVTVVSSPSVQLSLAKSDLGSAPTAISPSPQPAGSSSSSSLGSRTRWTAPPPPLPELPFALPAPPEIQNAASLLRLRPPPLVARSRERTDVLALLERVESSRRTHVLVFVGEAGVGKSRLARWALAEVERSGRMESTAAGYDPSGTSDGLRRALGHLLGPLPSARFALEGVDQERLANWFDTKGSSTQLPLSDRVELAEAVVSSVAALRPLYLWLDDVAWSHDGALDLVERLLSRADLPVAVVMTIRAGALEHPSVRERLTQLRGYAEYLEETLERLDREARRELLAAAAPLAPSTAEQLAEALDETPLLLVQLAQELVATGAFIASREGYVLPPDRSLSELHSARPAASVLEERIAKLLFAFRERASDAERALMVAALSGNRFEESMVVAASDSAQAGFVQVVIGRALLNGVLRTEPNGGYRFEHDLLREAVRERLRARRDRAEILARTARAMLQVYGEQRWEIRVRAARLFEAAGELDTALAYLADTAMELSLLSWFARSREICEEAAAIVQRQPSERARARLCLAESVRAYFELRYDDGLAEARRGRELALAAGDSIVAARCLGSEASNLFYMRRLAESERAARALLAECRLGDADMAESGLNAAHRVGEIHVLRGDIEGARPYFEKAVEYAESEPGLRRAGYLQLDLAEIDVARGDLAAARARVERCRELAQSPRSGDWREFIHDLDLRLTVREGRGEQALSGIATRIAELEARGDRWRVTAFRLLDAFARAEAGRRSEVPAAVAAFLAAFERCPHEKALSLWLLAELPQRLDALGFPAEAQSVARVRRDLLSGFAEGH